MKVKEGRAPPQDVTKQCSQCGEAKPGTCFSPNTTSPDGLRSNCKDCQSKCANSPGPATQNLTCDSQLATLLQPSLPRLSETPYVLTSQAISMQGCGAVPAAAGGAGGAALLRRGTSRRGQAAP